MAPNRGGFRAGVVSIGLNSQFSPLSVFIFTDDTKLFRKIASDVKTVQSCRRTSMLWTNVPIGGSSNSIQINV